MRTLGKQYEGREVVFDEEFASAGREQKLDELGRLGPRRHDGCGQVVFDPSFDASTGKRE